MANAELMESPVEVPVDGAVAAAPEAGEMPDASVAQVEQADVTVNVEQLLAEIKAALEAAATEAQTQMAA